MRLRDLEDSQLSENIFSASNFLEKTIHNLRINVHNFCEVYKSTSNQFTRVLHPKKKQRE